MINEAGNRQEWATAQGFRTLVYMPCALRRRHHATGGNRSASLYRGNAGHCRTCVQTERTKCLLIRMPGHTNFWKIRPRIQGLLGAQQCRGKLMYR